MKFDEVHKIIKGIPFILEKNARALYEFILKNEFSECLELGFAHGAASCYMAAALDELGKGKLVSVDLLGQEGWQKPCIEELLSKLGLERYVEIHRENSGYNWFLHRDIVQQSENDNKTCIPKYDFCIIDGPKNWTIDSSAFFLVDKLLKGNGWIVFDDYGWTYAAADRTREATDGITHRSLAKDEIETPHIHEIFHLLVMQHPAYANFKIQNEGDWVWAQKKQSGIKKVTYSYNDSYNDIVARLLYKLKKVVKNN